MRKMFYTCILLTSVNSTNCLFLFLLFTYRDGGALFGFYGYMYSFCVWCFSLMYSWKIFSQRSVWFYCGFFSIKNVWCFVLRLFSLHVFNSVIFCRKWFPVPQTFFLFIVSKHFCFKVNSYIHLALDDCDLGYEYLGVVLWPFA